MPARIKEAAVKQDGCVWTGRRHGEIILRMKESGGCYKVTQDQQGFVTEDGEYLTREEAYSRAVECGQIKDDSGTRCLLSEMLY